MFLVIMSLLLLWMIFNTVNVATKWADEVKDFEIDKNLLFISLKGNDK
jgi:hypothetical protein